MTSTVAYNLTRPRRPRWLATAWAVIAAMIFTVAFLGVPALALIWLGLFDNLGGTTPMGIVTGPYLPVGWWSGTVDLAVAAFGVFFTRLILKGLGIGEPWPAWPDPAPRWQVPVGA